MPGFAAALPAIIKGVGGVVGAAGGIKSLLDNSNAYPAQTAESAKDQAHRTYLSTVKSMQGQLEIASRAREDYGIHPLAALGISPAISGFGTISPGQKKDKGAIVSKIGQDISRAASAMQTTEEKEVTRAQADMLRAQASYYRSHAVTNKRGEPPTPGVPDGTQKKEVIEGQADQVKTIPVEVLSASAEDPSRSAGANPSQDLYISPGNILRSGNAEKLGEALESDKVANADITGDKITKRLYEIVNGLKRPEKTPHQINKAFPKNYVWKKVRTITGPAWKAVAPTRVAPKDRPGFERHIPRKKGLVQKNRAVLRNLERFKNQSY